MNAASLILLATLIGQETPDIGPANPCAPKEATIECESFLADAAIFWEGKYKQELKSHEETLKVCFDLHNVAPSPNPPEQQFAWWLPISGVAILASIIVGVIVLH